jgi:hypothetical protein
LQEQIPPSFSWKVDFVSVQLLFQGIDLFEKKSQRLFSRNSFWFRMTVFELFSLNNCSAIGRVVSAFVTEMTPHFGRIF